MLAEFVQSVDVALVRLAVLGGEWFLSIPHNSFLRLQPTLLLNSCCSMMDCIYTVVLY